jgi:hypothetical protein
MSIVGEGRLRGDMKNYSIRRIIAFIRGQLLPFKGVQLNSRLEPET